MRGVENEIRDILGEPDRLGAALLGHSKSLDLYSEDDGGTLDYFEKNEDIN